MNFQAELRRQRAIARRRLVKAQRSNDLLMTEAMNERLADLQRIAEHNSASLG